MSTYHISTILWQYNIYIFDSYLTKKCYFWNEIPIKYFIIAKLVIGNNIMLLIVIIK